MVFQCFGVKRKIRPHVTGKKEQKHELQNIGHRLTTSHVEHENI